MRIELLSRRAFVSGSVCAAFSARAIGKPLPPAHLGVELYTVRNLMPAQDDSVLRAIAQIGYKEIEGGYDDLKRIAERAKADNLNPISCHIPTEAVLGGDHYHGPEFQKILDDLRAIGTQYAVVPYIAPNLRNAATFDEFGDKLNRAGEMARKAGLQLCYHNHAFEWGQMDGKRVFDRMFGKTDPKLVQFEVDVFWLSVGGVSPTEFLNEHAGRVPLVHLKDKAAGQAVQYNENVPHETFKEVGSGGLDFPAILRTAEKIGVKHYFVEQDWTPGDPIASLRKSYAYITGLRA